MRAHLLSQRLLSSSVAQLQALEAQLLLASATWTTGISPERVFCLFVCFLDDVA